MNADKYTTKVREALGAAQNVAQHHGQQQFDAEHVLFALLKDSQGLIPNLFSKIGASLPTLTAQMEEAINRKPRITGSIEADKFYISNDLANILMRAEDAAKEMKDEYVSVEHLILGIMRNGATDAAKAIKSANEDFNTVVEKMGEVIDALKAKLVSSMAGLEEAMKAVA